MKCKNLIMGTITMPTDHPGVAVTGKVAAVECNAEIKFLEPRVLTSQLKEYWCPECGNLTGVKV